MRQCLRVVTSRPRLQTAPVWWPALSALHKGLVPFTTSRGFWGRSQYHQIIHQWDLKGMKACASRPLRQRLAAPNGEAVNVSCPVCLATQPASVWWEWRLGGVGTRGRSQGVAPLVWGYLFWELTGSGSVYIHSQSCSPTALYVIKLQRSVQLTKTVSK